MNIYYVDLTYQELNETGAYSVRTLYNLICLSKVDVYQKCTLWR